MAAPIGSGLPAAGYRAAASGASGWAWREAARGRIVYATIAMDENTMAGPAAPRGRAGIYRSDDGGQTWQLVNDDGALASSYFGRLSVAPRDRTRSM